MTSDLKQGPAESSDDLYRDADENSRAVFDAAVGVEYGPPEYVGRHRALEEEPDVDA